MRAPNVARYLYARDCHRTGLYPLYEGSASARRGSIDAGRVIRRTALLYHPLLIVIVIVAAGVGLCLGYVGQRVATRRRRRESEERVHQVLQEAEREAESKIREALLEAKDSWYQTKARLEQEAEATKLELQRLEKKILLREESLE